MINTKDKSPTEINRELCRAKYAQQSNPAVSTAQPQTATCGPSTQFKTLCDRLKEHAPMTAHEELKSMRMPVVGVE